METEKNSANGAAQDASEPVAEQPTEQTIPETATQSATDGIATEAAPPADTPDWTGPEAASDGAAAWNTQPMEFPSDEPAVRENILAGFVGAFLFSLGGGVLYFLLYQMGFIAGICGLVTFVLANFGYGRLSGNKKGDSIPGLVASIIMLILVIFLAEYLCVAYEIYRVYSDELFEITFFDVVRVMPDFLSEGEILSAFIGDLVFAYALGAVASISTIARSVKARKQKIV